MPKKFLLPGVEIKRFRAAKRLHGTFFSLGIAPLSPAVHARAAFVISKKVALKANARNLLKRRVKAASLPLIRRMPPLALVFTAKKGAAEAPYAAIRADAADLLEKAARVAAGT